MAASPLPSRGPKRGRKCYVTPTFSGIPNAKRGEQNQKWSPTKGKPSAAQLHRRPLQGPNWHFLNGLLRDGIIDGWTNMSLNGRQLRGIGLIKRKVPQNGLYAHVPKVALPNQQTDQQTQTQALQ